MKIWRRLTGAVIFSIALMAGLVYFEYLVYPGIHLGFMVFNCVISVLFGFYGYFLGSVLEEEAEFKKNLTDNSI